MAVAKKTKQPTHEVRLIIKDRVWRAKGNSTLSALQKLKEPTDVKAHAEIHTVIDEKLAFFPRRLSPTKIKRIFANEWEMELLAKQIDILR